MRCFLTRLRGDFHDEAISSCGGSGGAVPFDWEASVEKACRLTAEVADKGAALAVFPEAFISVYPKGLDFGSRVGSRTPEGREQFRRYWASAIEVPGPATEALGKAARENRIHVVIGVIERDGGTLYCTALFFAPDGTLLGKHRKLMPTAHERLVWGFGDGSTMPVFDTEIGKIGGVICWENYMPMLRMAMYSKKSRSIALPRPTTARPGCRPCGTLRLRAVALCSPPASTFSAADFPPIIPRVQGDDPNTVLMRGGSCIIDPLGRVLAAPSFEGECILTAEIDLDEIPRAKYDFDVVGHYARPDVFRLFVNERQTAPVTGAVQWSKDAMAAKSAK